MAKEPNRKVDTKQDLGSIDAIQHNDATGTKKVMVVQPTVVRATTANEPVGAGKLILIAATTYNLVMAGRDYNASNTYQQGDIAVSSGRVYLCNADQVTGAFDATKWIDKAPSTITGINAPANSVVSTGRWHNAVSVTGFLVDDESSISYARIRD